MAGFIVCSLAPDYEDNQLGGKPVLPTTQALECTTDENVGLRQWATIVAAHTWHLNANARWEATRDNAPEKLMKLLGDEIPEVI